MTFKYGPFGKRIYKQSPNATSIFVYDGDNLVQTANSTGGLVAHYAQTMNIDEPLAMQRSGTTYYYEADGLGSVTSLSSSAGALANTYTYDSFGNVTNSTGSVTNFLEYTGREFDTKTGLYYYRARYYDPNSGRFMSGDPMWFVDGPNLFAYVRNNPTGFLDPTGLAQLCCRPANVGIANAWARLTSQQKPCHCFVRLSDGTTLGGYFKFGLLLPEQNDNSDFKKYARQAKCKGLPGKPCESDSAAKRNFDSEDVGIYGLSGTSNAVAVDISGGLALPGCAWGQTPPSLPSLPSFPWPQWPPWPGFPDGGLRH